MLQSPSTDYLTKSEKQKDINNEGKEKEGVAVPLEEEKEEEEEEEEHDEGNWLFKMGMPRHKRKAKREKRTRDNNSEDDDDQEEEEEEEEGMAVVEERNETTKKRKTKKLKKAMASTAMVTNEKHPKVFRYSRGPLNGFLSPSSPVYIPPPRGIKKRGSSGSSDLVPSEPRIDSIDEAGEEESEAEYEAEQKALVRGDFDPLKFPSLGGEKTGWEESTVRKQRRRATTTTTRGGEIKELEFERFRNRTAIEREDAELAQLTLLKPLILKQYQREILLRCLTRLALCWDRPMGLTIAADTGLGKSQIIMKLILMLNQHLIPRIYEYNAELALKEGKAPPPLPLKREPILIVCTKVGLRVFKQEIAREFGWTARRNPDKFQIWYGDIQGTLRREWIDLMRQLPPTGWKEWMKTHPEWGEAMDTIFEKVGNLEIVLTTYDAIRETWKKASGISVTTRPNLHIPPPMNPPLKPLQELSDLPIYPLDFPDRILFHGASLHSNSDDEEEASNREAREKLIEEEAKLVAEEFAKIKEHCKDPRFFCCYACSPDVAPSAAEIEREWEHRQEILSAFESSDTSTILGATLEGAAPPAGVGSFETEVTTTTKSSTRSRSVEIKGGGGKGGKEEQEQEQERGAEETEEILPPPPPAPAKQPKLGEGAEMLKRCSPIHRQWSIVIADESSVLKNHKPRRVAQQVTLRCLAFWDISYRMIIKATATPIEKGVADLRSDAVFSGCSFAKEDKIWKADEEIKKIEDGEKLLKTKYFLLKEFVSRHIIPKTKADVEPNLFPDPKPRLQYELKYSLAQQIVQEIIEFGNIEFKCLVAMNNPPHIALQKLKKLRSCFKPWASNEFRRLHNKQSGEEKEEKGKSTKEGDDDGEEEEYNSDVERERISDFIRKQDLEYERELETKIPPFPINVNPEHIDLTYITQELANLKYAGDYNCTAAEVALARLYASFTSRIKCYQNEKLNFLKKWFPDKVKEVDSSTVLQECSRKLKQELTKTQDQTESKKSTDPLLPENTIANAVRAVNEFRKETKQKILQKEEIAKARAKAKAKAKAKVKGKGKGNVKTRAGGSRKQQNTKEEKEEGASATATTTTAITTPITVIDSGSEAVGSQVSSAAVEAAATTTFAPIDRKSHLKKARKGEGKGKCKNKSVGMKGRRRKPKPEQRKMYRIHTENDVLGQIENFRKIEVLCVIWSRCLVRVERNDQMIAQIREAECKKIRFSLVSPEELSQSSSSSSSSSTPSSSSSSSSSTPSSPSSSFSSSLLSSLSLPPLSWLYSMNKKYCLSEKGEVLWDLICSSYLGRSFLVIAPLIETLEFLMQYLLFRNMQCTEMAIEYWRKYQKPPLFRQGQWDGPLFSSDFTAEKFLRYYGGPSAEQNLALSKFSKKGGLEALLEQCADWKYFYKIHAPPRTKFLVWRRKQLHQDMWDTYAYMTTTSTTSKPLLLQEKNKKSVKKKRSTKVPQIEKVVVNEEKEKETWQKCEIDLQSQSLGRLLRRHSLGIWLRQKSGGEPIEPTTTTACHEVSELLANLWKQHIEDATLVTPPQTESQSLSNGLSTQHFLDAIKRNNSPLQICLISREGCYCPPLPLQAFAEVELLHPILNAFEGRSNNIQKDEIVFAILPGVSLPPLAMVWLFLHFRYHIKQVQKQEHGVFLYPWGFQRDDMPDGAIPLDVLEAHLVMSGFSDTQREWYLNFAAQVLEASRFLYDVMLAANYLGYTPMVEFLAACWTSLLKGKDVETIRDVILHQEQATNEGYNKWKSSNLEHGIDGWDGKFSEGIRKYFGSKSSWWFFPTSLSSQYDPFLPMIYLHRMLAKPAVYHYSTAISMQHINVAIRKYDIREINSETFQPQSVAERIMFVSLKAGGTSLNFSKADVIVLPFADTVPASEIQAIGRINRPPQKKATQTIQIIYSAAGNNSITSEYYTLYRYNIPRQVFQASMLETTQAQLAQLKTLISSAPTKRKISKFAAQARTRTPWIKLPSQVEHVTTTSISPSTSTSTSTTTTMTTTTAVQRHRRLKNSKNLDQQTLLKRRNKQQKQKRKRRIIDMEEEDEGRKNVDEKTMATTRAITTTKRCETRAMSQKRTDISTQRPLATRRLQRKSVKTTTTTRNAIESLPQGSLKEGQEEEQEEETKIGKHKKEKTEKVDSLGFGVPGNDDDGDVRDNVKKLKDSSLKTYFQKVIST